MKKILFIALMTSLFITSCNTNVQKDNQSSVDTTKVDSMDTDTIITDTVAMDTVIEK